MARIIYPINDKRYTAEDVEIYNIPRTSGVYAVLDFDCSLSGDTLTIGKGLAWIKNGEFSGKTVAFTEPETLTLEYADDTYNRYDVVAIRYDATKTEPELVVKKGVASASPELPARSTETYLYELYLYSILREKGESFPLFANITDLRRDKNYCGIMRDSVTSVVDVMRETLYEDENGAGQLDLISAGGMTLEPEEYGSLIATIKYGNVSIDMPLYKVNTTSRSWVFAGETKTPSNGTFTIELQPVSGGFSVETATQDSGSSPQNAKITKLVGIPEKSQGYVAVDSLYNPESHNAQSGEAVKQAIEEALENFEGGGGDIEIPENVETTDNKVTTIDETSTDEQYPSAKAVYDLNSNLFEQGKNLFNGVYEVGRANGDDSKTSESRSEWIAVDEGEAYTFSHSKSTSSFIIYGKTNAEDSVQIHNGNIEKNYTFTIPEDVTHIRFSAYNTVLNSNNIQIEKGSEATSYEPYRVAIKEELLPTNGSTEIPEDIQEQIEQKQDKLVNGVNIKTINNQSILGSGNINIDAVVNGDGSPVVENSAFQTLPVGKNLLNRATNTVGYKLNETGGLVSASSYEVTDFISITENTEYCLSKNNGANAYAPLILYFDVKKEIIGSEKNKATYPITSPANAKFVRLTVEKSATLLQFEQGNKITEYEEFNGASLIDGNKINFVPKSITPKEVNFFSTKAGGKNLLDRTKSTIGYGLTSTGELATSTNNEVSDFIPVAFGDNLYISGTPDSGYTSVVTSVAFYDEDRNCIWTNTSVSTIENPIAVPKNAKYVRYTYRKAGTNIQIERGTGATEYEAYIPVPCLANEYLGFKMPNDLNYSFNPWHGKRLVVDGDSITHDQGRYDYWQFVVAKQHEMYLDISNTSAYASGWKGVGGSRIANELGTNDPNQSIVLRYMNLPDDADLVVIAGGTNDWAHNNVDLGDFDSTDNTTFNGALNELLPALKSKYPLIPVVMMTPIKRGITHNATNTKGLTLEQFVDAMIAKCRQYGVYCLDMYSNCPINPQIPTMKDLLFEENDETHPNTEGHKIMGRTVAGFIRTLA